MQDSYNKQQVILLNLQDNNNKLLEGLRNKDEEMTKMKSNTNEKHSQINKLKIEIRKLQQAQGNIQKTGKENAELSVQKASYEKKIGDMAKDLAFYKDAAE